MATNDEVLALLKQRGAPPTPENMQRVLDAVARDPGVLDFMRTGVSNNEDDRFVASRLDKMLAPNAPAAVPTGTGAVPVEPPPSAAPRRMQNAPAAGASSVQPPKVPLGGRVGDALDYADRFVAPVTPLGVGGPNGASPDGGGADRSGWRVPDWLAAAVLGGPVAGAAGYEAWKRFMAPKPATAPTVSVGTPTMAPPTSVAPSPPPGPARPTTAADAALTPWDAVVTPNGATTQPNPTMRPPNSALTTMDPDAYLKRLIDTPSAGSPLLAYAVDQSDGEAPTKKDVVKKRNPRGAVRGASGSR